MDEAIRRMDETIRRMDEVKKVVVLLAAGDPKAARKAAEKIKDQDIRKRLLASCDGYEAATPLIFPKCSCPLAQVIESLSTLDNKSFESLGDAWRKEHLRRHPWPSED
jgi:hypothetical protein